MESVKSLRQTKAIDRFSRRLVGYVRLTQMRLRAAGTVRPDTAPLLAARRPVGRALLEEGAQAFLRLGCLALAGDHPGCVPFR